MLDVSNTEAVAISDEMLEQTRLAAFTRDFTLFSRWFVLPHTVTTFEKSRVITTIAEMEMVFNAQCDGFVAMQVTDMVRKCMPADYDGPDCIKSMHVTHLMSGSRRAQDPYPALMMLERHDGEWRVSKSDYAVKAGSGFEKALSKMPPLASQSTDNETQG